MSNEEHIVTMMKTIPAVEFADYIGKELEPSNWLKIEQERVNQFADATSDHQFIHIDAEAAAKTPFGGTIAHGFLTLSLLSHLLGKSGVSPKYLVMAINYGLNKVRFLEPVKVGQRVRVHQKITEVLEKRPQQWLITSAVSMEIEGEKKPAFVAEMLGLFIVEKNQ